MVGVRHLGQGVAEGARLLGELEVEEEQKRVAEAVQVEEEEEQEKMVKVEEMMETEQG